MKTALVIVNSHLLFYNYGFVQVDQHTSLLHCLFFKVKHNNGTCVKENQLMLIKEVTINDFRRSNNKRQVSDLEVKVSGSFLL